jgi:hypothetical protein
VTVKHALACPHDGERGRAARVLGVCGCNLRVVTDEPASDAMTDGSGRREWVRARGHASGEVMWWLRLIGSERAFVAILGPGIEGRLIALVEDG